MKERDTARLAAILVLSPAVDIGPALVGGGS